MPHQYLAHQRPTLATATLALLLVAIMALSPSGASSGTRPAAASTGLLLAGNVGPSSPGALDLGALLASPRIGVPDGEPGIDLPGSVYLGPSTVETVPVLLTLDFSNASRLAALLAALDNRTSPEFHQYLTQAQFDRLFAGSPEAYAAAVNFVESFGVSRVTTYADRATVTFDATPVQVARIFGTELGSFRHGNEVYFAPTSRPSLPAPLAGFVVSVEGLSNYSQYLIRLPLAAHDGEAGVGAPSPQLPAKAGYLPPVNFSGVQLEYAPDVQVAYDEVRLFSGYGYPTDEVVATILASGSNGSGVPVGPFVPSDIYTFYNETIPAGEPHSHVYGVPLNGAPPPGPSASYDDTDANVENTLDLEMVGSTAPGASIYNVYSSAFTGEALDADFAYILNPNGSFPALENVSAISNSWGATDANDSSWYQDLEEAQVRGISVLAASGDSGDIPATDWLPGNTFFPSSMAYDAFGDTAVGGTTLTLNSTTLLLSADPVWYENDVHGSIGSSGGVSSVFPEPSWQLSTEANDPIRSTGSSGRGAPDLAAMANNTLMTLTLDGTQYNATNATLGGGFVYAAGTSIASPLEAGTVATIDHALAVAHRPGLGYLNPNLYSIGDLEFEGVLPADDTPLLDVVEGGNYLYPALPGYDLATGWGTLDAWNFTWQLVPPPSVFLVTFWESGLAPGTAWSVTLNGTPKSSSQDWIAFGSPNGTQNYTVSPIAGYTLSPRSGNVSVNGANENVEVTFTRVTYAVAFTESGLPATDDWTVDVTGGLPLLGTAGEATLTEEIPNGTWFFTVTTNDPLYTPSYVPSFTVNAGPVSVPVTFSLRGPTVSTVTSTLVLFNNSLVKGNFLAANGISPTGEAYDSRAGEMFVTGTYSNSVSVINDTTDRVTAIIGVGANPSQIAYDSGRGELFVSNIFSENVSVINATTDQVVASVPVGGCPEGIAYVGSRGLVFVANECSDTVSVINDTHDAVVDTFDVGPNPCYFAYDPAKGELFLSNTSDSVSVINATTYNLVATVTVGEYAIGIAYDHHAGEVFVADENSNEVSVINDTSNTVVATVAVGASPIGLSYDAATGEVYVANAGGEIFPIIPADDDVSVISDATNTVVATIGVGSEPFTTAIDTGKGEVFVLDTGSDDVTVVSAVTDGVVATVPIGTNPFGMAYDSGQNEVVTVNSYENAADVISATTDEIVATVPQGPNPTNGAFNAYGVAFAYDSRKGEVFVANTFANSVNVVNDTSHSIVATVETGTYPDGTAYDSRTGEIFVANWGGNDVSVLNDTSNTVVATISVGDGPTGVAYDRARGEVFVTNRYSNSVSVVNDTTNQVVATVSVGSGPYGVAYDPRQGEVFVANSGYGYIGFGSSDTVSIINDTTDALATNVTVGKNPMGVAYASGVGRVLVTDYGSDVVSQISDATDAVVATVAVGSGPIGVVYDPSNGNAYVANYGQGTVSVISFTRTYIVNFTESGLPAGTPWSVVVTNGPAVESAPDGTMVAASNGSYSYRALSENLTYASPGGTFTVAGAALNVSVTFTRVVYRVTFAETGLAPGTEWWVNLTNGPSFNGTGADISVFEPNATYTYSIASADKTRSSPGGAFTVDGSPVTEPVAFSLVTYTLTFTETGLPVGTAWNVTVGPATLTTNTSGINFTEPNGTYPYVVGPVSGYSVSSAGRSVTVSGGAEEVSIRFSKNSGGATVLGLPAVEGYSLIAGVVVVVAALVGIGVVISRRRKHRTTEGGPPTPAPPSGPPGES